MQKTYLSENEPVVFSEHDVIRDISGHDQYLVRARILVAEKGLLMAMTRSGAISCKTAASCLLQPEAGDTVLVSLPEHGGDAAYILAVLQRLENNSVMRLDLGSGARITAENGPVEIAAGTDLRLSAGNHMEASAPDMSFVSSSVRWLTRVFSLVGKTVEAVCSVWRESSRERETTTETWVQRLGDCHRHVQDLDETQAGTSRTLARETALLHGRVTYVQAEEFVKVDGQEVHLG